MRQPESAAGGLLQLFLGDARGGESLVFGPDGRTRFNHLAGGVEDFPMPVGIGAAAALEAQLDLKSVVLGHDGVMAQLGAWGKGDGGKSSGGGAVPPCPRLVGVAPPPP